jgi:imidazolonepropionase-like amidohydrolase
MSRYSSAAILAVLTFVTAGAQQRGASTKPDEPVERPRAATQKPAPPPAPSAAKPVPTKPRSQPQPSGPAAAIVNARILAATGPIIERGTIVMRGGQVEAIGANVQPPAGARVIDAAGKTVTPGFLDSATQIGIVEISTSAEGTADHRTTDSRVSAAFTVVDAFNANSTVIPVTRVEGVTRALVTPDGTGNVLVGQGAVFDFGGAQVPDSITRAPAAMVALMGEPGAAVAGGSRSTAVLRLREILQDAMDYARNRTAFEAAQRREYVRSRLDLEAMQRVLKGEVPLAIQVNRASDILAALRLGDEFKLRVVLLGAAEAWMVAGDLASRKVPVVVKPLTNVPTFDSLGATLENAARLSKAGVVVALATFDTHNSRNLRQEAGNAIAYGMDRQAALQAVTIVPARIWGVADRVGSIEAGKDADLVVWSGDPFELTTIAERVFIRGQEIAKDTRQRQLLERYRDLGALGR